MENECEERFKKSSVVFGTAKMRLLQSAMRQDS